jgi:hypothetical protein
LKVVVMMSLRMAFIQALVNLDEVFATTLETVVLNQR